VFGNCSVKAEKGKNGEGGSCLTLGGGGKGGGGGAGMTRSCAEGGAATLARAWRRRAVSVVTLHGEETGEGKGVDRWARATNRSSDSNPV
jgi:hypothetical protein